MNRIIDAQIETGTRTSCTRTLQTRRATSTSGSSSRPTCAPRSSSTAQRGGRGLQPRVAVPPQFMTNDGFSHEALADVTAKLVRNLNSIIDRNYYPTEHARVSNLKHRPIGIGVQAWRTCSPRRGSLSTRRRRSRWSAASSA
jgi:ribonucleoside-diphosphate reductase alpha chain